MKIKGCHRFSAYIVRKDGVRYNIFTIFFKNLKKSVKYCNAGEFEGLKDMENGRRACPERSRRALVRRIYPPPM